MLKKSVSSIDRRGELCITQGSILSGIVGVVAWIIQPEAVVYPYSPSPNACVATNVTPVTLAFEHLKVGCFNHGVVASNDYERCFWVGRRRRVGTGSRRTTTVLLPCVFLPAALSSGLRLSLCFECCAKFPFCVCHLAVSIVRRCRS